MGSHNYSESSDSYLPINYAFWEVKRASSDTYRL